MTNNNTEYPTVLKQGKKKKLITTKSEFSKEKCLNCLRELLEEKNKTLDDEIQKNNRLFQKFCKSLQIQHIISKNSKKKKYYDVFISYRRSNGSHLASLLKLHLTNQNLNVFLDVESLEGGKFEANISKSIRSARNFVLILTPESLDRCIGDEGQKDWIHKEICCALQSQCNIIPVFDNFPMPKSQDLPATMREITSFNGVNWIHEYQNACVDKILRFVKMDEPQVAATEPNKLYQSLDEEWNLSGDSSSENEITLKGIEEKIEASEIQTSPEIYK